MLQNFPLESFSKAVLDHDGSTAEYEFYNG